MTLSNRAVPKYYGIFRDKVLRGEIPVNAEMELEMNRIDKLIADPFYYYDDKAVEGFIKFCEGELTLTDGEPIVLLLTFKLWAEQIFGWYWFEERQVYQPDPDNHGGRYVTKKFKYRLTQKQYLIVARGAAKSMYAACIQAYFLTINTETTQQITTAPTMVQANEVMSPINTAITRAPGPLFQFLTEGSIQNTTGSRANRVKLAGTKKGIENFLTGSILEVRPMSIDKLQGLRPKCSTVDEWLSGDVREDVVGAIEQGAGKMKDDDYLIVAMSSEGTVRNGPGDTVKMELMNILNGETYAPHVSIFHYKLDDIKEVARPEMWPKAQPNIGITVSYDTYHKEVDRMEAAPHVRNDVLAKRFGIPMEGYTRFFTYEETIPHRPYNPRKYVGAPCAMGADLSQGDDFCAFTFLFPGSRGEFGVKTRSYISERTLNKLPGGMRAKYDDFIRENSLHVMDGNVLNMMEVYDDLEALYLKMEYDIRAFGFDPWGAREFVTRWEQENGPQGIEKVIQGARTESIPLGELKILSEERLLLFDEDIMQFAMGNAITMEDNNGNRKLMKKRQDQKIDNVAALMDAWVAYKANRDDFE